MATSGAVDRSRTDHTVWRSVVAQVGVLAALGLVLVVFDDSDLSTYNLAMLALLGAVALNLLMGTAGQVSVGNSAFMAVGAYSSVLVVRSGIPFPLDVAVAACVGALAGLVVGLPAARLRGLYLALATLAGLFIAVRIGTEYQLHAGSDTTSGFYFSPLFIEKGLDGGQVYWAALMIVVAAGLLAGAHCLSHLRAGRAWRMIRDHDIAAATLGIPVTRYKLSAFMLTSAVIAAQGALLGHYVGSVAVETYTFDLAVTYVAMVLIGGVDSVGGAIIGAGIITSLPILTPRLTETFLGSERALSMGPSMSTIVYGVLIIVFVTSSPRGIVGLVEKLKRPRHSVAPG